MIPVLDIDPQQRLPREAELRELEVVQVPAADGGHVVAVVPVLGEGSAHVQHIVAVPGVVLLRTDEAKGGGGLGVGGDGGEQLLGVGRDVGEGVSVARALAHAAAQQQPVRLRVQHQHLGVVVGVHLGGGAVGALRGAALVAVQHRAWGGVIIQ